jgi:hypothetical protein
LEQFCRVLHIFHIDAVPPVVRAPEPEGDGDFFHRPQAWIHKKSRLFGGSNFVTVSSACRLRGMGAGEKLSRLAISDTLAAGRHFE